MLTSRRDVHDNGSYLSLLLFLEEKWRQEFRPKISVFTIEKKFLKLRPFKLTNFLSTFLKYCILLNLRFSSKIRNSC